MPRLELVATHVTVNLADNIKIALTNMNVRNEFGWTDSTVVLHWLGKNGNYNQFVNTRVDKIQEKDYTTWRDVPRNDNPADIGSRGVYGISNSHLIVERTNLASRQRSVALTANYQSKWRNRKAKKITTVLAAKIKLFEVNKFDTLLEKLNLWKFLRIKSWVSRFISNARRTKVKGPLTTEELINQQKFWSKREQQRYMNDDKFKLDTDHLNIKENTGGIYECQGRILGHYPVYLPSKSLLSEKSSSTSIWRLFMRVLLFSYSWGRILQWRTSGKTTGYQD